MATDYDPVKAHEYYMRTRQLKGRTSTAKLSKKKKEMAAYIKNQLSEEKKEKQKALNAKMKEKIANLRAHLKAMPPEQRKRMKEAINYNIGQLRDAYKADKTTLKETYAKKYEDELAKLRKSR